MLRGDLEDDSNKNAMGILTIKKSVDIRRIKNQVQIQTGQTSRNGFPYSLGSDHKGAPPKLKANIQQQFDGYMAYGSGILPNHRHPHFTLVMFQCYVVLGEGTDVFFSLSLGTVLPEGLKQSPD